MVSEQQKPHNTLFASRLLLAVLVVNLSLSLSYIGFWLIAARQNMFWRADFSAFYTGWAIVRDGQGANLYDPELQTDYQMEILEGNSFEDGLLPYVYPPHMTIPFVPLAYASRAAALGIWFLAQVVTLIWLLWLLNGLAGSWEANERLLLFSTVIAFPALLLSFMVNSFFFLTLCLLQFYLALKHSREGRAGLWLVIGTVKPQVMLLPGVLLLAARRWRALLSALLIGSALVILSIVVLGWQAWLDYLRILRTHAGLFNAFGVTPADMYNLKGTLALLLGNDQGVLINQISYLALMIVAVLTFWLWHKWWRPADPSFELQMALTLLLGLLFSPHLNPQDGLILVVPATLFYIYLRQRDLPRRAFAVFVLICPFIFFVSEFAFGAAVGIRIPVIAMLVFGVWMVKALYDERRVSRMDLEFSRE